MIFAKSAYKSLFIGVLKVGFKNDYWNIET